MRRSEWRRRADDPKTLLGWWWRELRDYSWRWPLGALAFVTMAWGSTNGRSVLVDSLATGVFIACLTATRRRRDVLAPLLPDPAPEGQFRAKVEYRQKGLTTGRDEMALCVVDGWLHAEGVRSQFALRPEDVSRLTTGSDHRGRLVLSDGSEVRLVGLDDPARIVLERWHRPDRWMEGTPTFPPLFVHPQQFARWIAWVVFGFLILAVPNGVKPFLPLPDLLSLPFFAVGMVLVFSCGRKVFRLVDLMVQARKDAVAWLPEGSSVFVDVFGQRIEIKGEASLSPQPPLQDEPLGEGESVRA